MGAGDREHEVVGAKFVEVFVDRGWLGLAVPGAHAPMQCCAEVGRSKIEAIGFAALMQAHDRLRVRDQKFG
jgi:hypothetical protein